MEQQIKSKSVIQVEEQFWDKITWEDTLYGSDVKGSLFKENSSYPWDLNKIPSVLKESLGSTKLGGITEPYLYIGAYGTKFGWHVEDLNLPSINYNHHGAPKFWYSIGREDYKKFESFIKDYYAEQFLSCSEYLRHKTIVVNPYFLKKECPDIRVEKIIQNPGEYVITLNGSYHCGFNFGFNIAEAVNFATPDWLPEFPKFKSCKCSSGTVYIDPWLVQDNLKKKYSKNRYFKDFEVKLKKM